MSQKLIFAIINFLFSHFIHSFFISIKLISLSRLKFGLNNFHISETKRSEQYFHISKDQACSKQNFKHKVIGVGDVDFEKIRFQIKHN